MITPAFALAAVFVLFALTGAIYDIRTRRIPNWLNAAFLVTGLVMVTALNGWEAGLSGLGHFAGALVAAMLIFALKLWGGGDAKFYAASAAWFPIAEALGLFVSIAMAGLIVALVWLLIYKLSGQKVKRGDKVMPYGVAIAVGGILMQLSNPVLGLLPY
ncbi:peptidase A24 [Croceicoccus ponticola]|uniref:Peptidase A24 n=1 Tax=Croceicoccus ponticola TaxID=2217664 RepID=A0A437H1H0_9SPHN|nr:prepilin peptidase [Croceicoccus ponticola]RVQ69386.1 peptidase A24 [Croceicoccus ponticola]